MARGFRGYTNKNLKDESSTNIHIYIWGGNQKKTDETEVQVSSSIFVLKKTPLQF